MSLPKNAIRQDCPNHNDVSSNRKSRRIDQSSQPYTSEDSKNTLHSAVNREARAITSRAMNSSDDPRDRWRRIQNDVTKRCLSAPVYQLKEEARSHIKLLSGNVRKKWLHHKKQDVSGKQNQQDFQEVTNDADMLLPVFDNWKSLTPFQRFQRAANRARLICKTFIAMKHYSACFEKGLEKLAQAATRRAQEASYKLGSGKNSKRGKHNVVFNADDYKSHFEFTWPTNAEHAMRIPPAQRSHSDIIRIRGLMRGLHSYRKLRKHMQDILCKAVKLERYGKERVVVRKGHIAQHYYFVFSGLLSVVPEVYDEDVFLGRHKQIAVLRKGDSFGDIGLVKTEHRTATVITLEDSELLVISQDEFSDTHLHEYFRKEIDERQIFLRNHPLFSSWTESGIDNASYQCKTEVYPHDTVIVKNSAECNNLLIVMKGMCHIYRLLKYPLPDLLTKVSPSNTRTPPEYKAEVSPERQSMSSVTDIIEELQEGFKSKDCRMTETFTLEYGGAGVYMTTATLEVGQCFGLPQVLRVQPEVSLISAGCELVSIPLSTLYKYGKNETIAMLKVLNFGMHNWSEMSQTFMKHNFWTNFRKTVLDETMWAIQQRKQQRQRIRNYDEATYRNMEEPFLTVKYKFSDVWNQQSGRHRSPNATAKSMSAMQPQSSANIKRYEENASQFVTVQSSTKVYASTEKETVLLISGFHSPIAY